MNRIGRYEILGELGRGAMGVVFRAVDPVIGRTVAIKTIKLQDFPDPAEQERLRERLFREARSAGILSHPGIVTVYDIGEDGDTAFIAMEYVQGSTLEQLVRDEGPPSPERFLEILADVAEALDYAHGRGIVHRDIKPGNIMVTTTGIVKITDFGVAKILSHQATQGDSMLGTPSYMAPEQISAKAVDGRTDQWALAVIAYELLSGERPFQAEAIAPLLFKIVRDEPAPVHRLNPSVSDRVSATLARAMSKAGTDRFSSCTAFVKELSSNLSKCAPGWRLLPPSAAGTLPTIATEAPAAGPIAAAVSDAAETIISTATAATEVVMRPARRVWPWVAGFSLLATAALIALAAAGFFADRWGLPKPAIPPIAQQRPQSPEVRGDKPSPSTPEPKPVDPPSAIIAPVKPPLPGTPVPKPPALVGGPQSGEVEIVSTPPGAEVRIDDTKDGCKTPCSIELSQGRHVLHFRLAGHRPGTVIISVPNEDQASIRLDPLLGTLMVHTEPAGAQIYLNGQLQQSGTPATLRLTPGKYKLLLKKEGMRDHAQDVEIREEGISNVDFTWQAR